MLVHTVNSARTMTLAHCHPFVAGVLSPGSGGKFRVVARGAPTVPMKSVYGRHKLPIRRGTWLAFSPPNQNPLVWKNGISTTASPNGKLEGTLIRIVLIEDDHLMREWLGRSLSSRGHDVRRFERANDALAAVVADAPDVIVSDIKLPGMSGIEFGRMLRARGIDIPIVFMTADPDPAIESDARALGSRWFLRKPFGDVADLWSAVDTAYASRPADEDLTEASHALRTPLTAVKMALEGLVAKRELTVEEKHLAEIANRNLDRLTDAVEDHLAQLAASETTD